MVPHLVTALAGPINELEQRILESLPATERWFRLEWMEHTPPFYTAVDVRNAGFKLAPVETNLFPGGFGRLTDAMLPLAVQAAMAAIEKICPEAKNLLLVPDSRLDDPDYRLNLERLTQVFTQAGLNVRLGSADPAIQAPQEYAGSGATPLRLEPLLRQRGRVGLKDFDPCTILLNTDLAGGVPKMLTSVHEQYLLPPLHAGWSTRRRSTHFRAYDEVAKKFAKLLGMDPWLINPMVASVETGAGLAGSEALQTQADQLLQKVRRKYKEYGITEKPFLIAKADHGPDGFGMRTVRDAKDLAGLAPDTPEGSAVILQEGVPTFERVDDAVAEPVVYMIDRYVVGGFYRAHAGRGFDEPLNAPGARIVPLGFADAGVLPKPGVRPGASAPNRFYMYGVVARLAMLAAAYELEATDPDAEIYE
jgi:glutamate--cysteine ligase